MKLQSVIQLASTNAAFNRTILELKLQIRFPSLWELLADYQMQLSAYLSGNYLPHGSTTQSNAHGFV